VLLNKKEVGRKKVTKSTLLILSIIMAVNALSFGIIIPLLYPYASKFEIGPIGLSMLFTSFSFSQFIATPIIGRLSDKYGRKPLLLLSLFGTSLSLALFASAGNIFILFLARTLDGITGGNISVAQACIADTLTGNARTKAYGMIGASFGFGFLVGPAIGGLLSPYGLTIPFWVASGIALLGTILGIFLLKETLPPAKRRTKKYTIESLFHFKALIHILHKPFTGIIIFILLLSVISHFSFIIGFQSFTVDILKLSASTIAYIFTLIGIISIFIQTIGIRILLKIFKQKRKVLQVGLIGASIALGFVTFLNSFTWFIVFLSLHTIFFTAINPMITGIISNRTDDKKQGEILGIAQSYMSIGQIIGPIIAGLLSTISLNLIFGFSCLASVIALILTRKIMKKI